MNLRDWYFKQIVSQGDMDQAFGWAEDADNEMMLDTELTGVHSGGIISEQTPTPDLTVNVSATKAHDKDGQRISIDTTSSNIDVSVDEYGTPTEVAAAGEERYISLFVRYKKDPQSPAVDGNGLTVYTVQVEDAEYFIRQGASATAGAAVPPALLSSAILLGDMKRAFGQAQIQNINIEEDRREDWVRMTGTNITEIVAGTSKEAVTTLFGYLDTLWSGGSPFTFTSTWETGAAPGGASPPITTIQEALDGIVYDLALKAGTAGAERVGITAQSGTYISWANTDISVAIKATATALEGHIAGGAPNHPDTAVTAAAKSSTPDSLSGGTVSTQLAELLSFANARIPKQQPYSSTPTTGYFLLWRSDNNADVTITINTVSIYYKSNSLLFVEGAYIASVNAISAAAGRMSVLFYDGVAMRRMERYAGAGGESTNYNSASGWDYYKEEGANTTETWQDHEYEAMDGTLTSVLHNFIPTTDQAQYVKLYEQSVTKHRVYVGGSVGVTASQFCVAYNCSWVDSPTYEWQADDTGIPSCILGVGKLGCLWFRYKSDNAVGWSDGDSNWDSIFKLGGVSGYGPTGDYVNNAFTAYGKIYEKKLIHANVTNDTGASTRVVWVTANFSNRRNDIPTSFGSTSITTAGPVTNAPVGAYSTGVAAEWRHWGGIFNMSLAFSGNGLGAAVAEVEVWD